LRNEINSAIQSVLDRGDFILGQDVSRLEEEFASYCGAKYAIGVDSGLSALELSLRAYGIGAGHEVILPAHTFTATAAAITFTGATPVFVDVNPGTWVIDAEKIEGAITPRTKAIIPVHLYGLPADMHMILGVAEKYNLVVVEDACQAHGAMYKGYRTGSLGHAAGFSFYPTKNLGGCGDGGMVTTNDAKIAETVRALRNCGQRVKNVHELSPFNHRLDSLQAAILRVKLNYLDDWNASRRRLATAYNELLSNTHVTVQVEAPGYQHVYHLYVIRLQDRDGLQEHLKERGIGTAIHYPTPVHLQPFYSNGKDRRGQFPITEKICNEILSLPLYPEMTDEQLGYVVKHIREFMTEKTTVTRA
jgi:dTDP-4-amino-4,6-dideoxygalactose transaminase